MAILLMLVALAASYVSTRRAIGVDPMVALRGGSFWVCHGDAVTER